MALFDHRERSHDIHGKAASRRLEGGRPCLHGAFRPGLHKTTARGWVQSGWEGEEVVEDLISTMARALQTREACHGRVHCKVLPAGRTRNSKEFLDFRAVFRIPEPCSFFRRLTEQTENQIYLLKIDQGARPDDFRQFVSLTLSPNCKHSAMANRCTCE